MSLFHPFPDDENDQVACFLFRDIHPRGDAEMHYTWLEGCVSRWPHVHGQPKSAVRRAALAHIQNTIFGNAEGACPFCPQTSGVAS